MYVCAVRNSGRKTRRCILNAQQRKRSFTYTLSVHFNHVRFPQKFSHTTSCSTCSTCSVVLLLRSSPSIVYLQENKKKAMDYTSHETGHEFAKLKYTKREIVCVLVFECVKNRLITRTTLSFSTRSLSSGGGGVLISPFLPSKIITWKYLITGHRSRNSLSLAFVVHRRTKVMCNKLTVP